MLARNKDYYIIHSNRFGSVFVSYFFVSTHSYYMPYRRKDAGESRIGRPKNITSVLTPETPDRERLFGLPKKNPLRSEGTWYMKNKTECVVSLDDAPVRDTCEIHMGQYVITWTYAFMG